jgi:DNA-binding NarL/FixJ family response regulator
MTRVFIADTRTEERFALNLLLKDMDLEVVGEAADWDSTLAQLPTSRTEMLLVDWDLLPNAARAALDDLRQACSAAISIVLISRLDARQQAAISSGADRFISKVENIERVTGCFRAVAASIDEQLAGADAGS